MRPFDPNPTNRIPAKPRARSAFFAALGSVSLLAAGAALSLLLAAHGAQAAPAVTAARGELVLWVPAGTDASRVAQVAASAGCDVVANLSAPSRYYLLRLKGIVHAGRSQPQPNQHVELTQVEEPSVALLQAIETVNSAIAGAKANPNYVSHKSRRQGTPVATTVTPNDTFYAGNQWDMRLINMPRAWAIQVGAKPVIVADMDTGLDVGNPDLQNVLPGINVAGSGGTPEGVSVDTTKTPVVYTTIGVAVTDVTDDIGHGTHTAGTIIATVNNGAGIAGVAGFNGGGVSVQLLPIKASRLTERLNNMGASFTPKRYTEEFFTDSIIVGIEQAITKGAVAINMSLGGLFGSVGDVTNQAINDALAAGTQVIASTGNEAIDNSLLATFPANYPGVIAVGAVGANGLKASYSDFGGNITLVAPGGDFVVSSNPLNAASSTQVLSTYPLAGLFLDGIDLSPAPGYAYMVGTSMACPHVTGAYALLRAAGASADEAKTALIASATLVNDPSSLAVSSNYYGAGLLNVGKALTPRVSFTGGNALGGSTVASSSSATDLGSSYFRNPQFGVQLTGAGLLLKQIAAPASQSSLTFQISTATVPSSPINTFTVNASLIPALLGGETNFVGRLLSLPGVNAPNLAPNRYKATTTLTYQGVTDTQVQYFEVLAYTQPSGRTLFSVPFIPADTAQPEAAVLGSGSVYTLYKYDPLRPIGIGTYDYARYLSPSGTSTDADTNPQAANPVPTYPRLTNKFNVQDPLHTGPNFPPLPLSYANGSPTVSLAPIGVGYWLDNAASETLNVVGTPATLPVAIPLWGLQDQYGNARQGSGWNMVGAPFTYPVNWSVVSIQQNTPTGVQSYTLAQAIANNIVGAPLVGWDQSLGGVDTRTGAATGDYYYSVYPNGQFLPFHGYWVRALQDCTLVVPPTRAQQTLEARAAKLSGRAAAEPVHRSAVPLGEGWRVRVAATVAGTHDAENFFGQVRGATNGENRFDIPKPPSGGSHAYVRFINNDIKGHKAAFAYDMRPSTAQNVEWTLAVGSDKGDSDVTLTWDGLSGLPNRSKLTLKDTVTGTVVPMKGRSSYTYRNTEAGATRLFTVALAPQASGGALQILNVHTINVGGTRAAGGGGVNVEFATNQDAAVTATVLSLSGKTVSVLDGGRAAAQGSTVLRWNGRAQNGSVVAPGTYLLEITAHADNGEAVTVRRPLTYLR